MVETKRVRKEYHRCSAKSGVPGWASFTREELLNDILIGAFLPQPPDWWLRGQVEQGRTIGAASAIWHRNYPAARKYVIWDQAPREDFFARGYLWSLSGSFEVIPNE